MSDRSLGTRTALAAMVAIALGCHDIDFSSRYAPGEIDIHDDLYSVSVPDPQTAIAVGYYGAIYKTTDGGGSWTKLDSGTQSSLYSVSMADPQKGWVVGQRGLIMRTEDGGQTWKRQPNVKEAQGTHLFAIHAIDANTAMTIGEWGTRLFTDDGGKTWQDRSLTIDESHPQFVWLAPVEQDAVRQGRRVYEDVGLNHVYCLPAPSQKCWIVGEFGYIFYSDTLGQKWERGQIIGEISIDPIGLPYNETDIGDADNERLIEFAELIADENHLNVDVEPTASAVEVQRFGKLDDPWELFEILDARALAVRSVLEEAGILSDRIRIRGGPPWDYEDFLEDDPDFLKRYLRERTEPKPGVHVRVAQNPYLFQVKFQDENLGLIAGLGGVVLRSEDSGRTWRYSKIDRKQALFSVALTDDRALAVGEKGLVRVSTDGGATWSEPRVGFPSVFTFMRAIDFAPGEQVAMIVGQSGSVLRSEDGGRSWKKVLPRPRQVASASSH